MPVTNKVVLSDSSGNVGIGTTPQYKLDVYTNGGTSAIRVNADANQNTQLRLEEAGAVKFAVTYVPADDSTRFFHNTTDLITLNASGNVGIGTTAPGSKLQVSPSSQFTTISSTDGLSIYNPSSTSANLILGINGSSANIIQSKDGASTAYPLALNPFGGNVGIGTTTPTTGTGGTGLQIHNASTGAGLKVSVGNFFSEFQVGNDGTTYLFTTSSKHIVLQTPASSGCVGIGTTTVNDKLEVRGADNGITISSIVANRPALSLVNGTTTMLRFSANGVYGAIGDGTSADRYMIFNAGNVGIGTTSPTAKLHVNSGFIKVSGTESDQYFLEGVRTGTSTTLRIYDNSSVVFYDSYNTMHFRANQNGGSGGTILFNGGNVGIGTTSPTAGKLAIRTGTQNTTGLHVGTTTAWSNNDETRIDLGDGVTALSRIASFYQGSSSNWGLKFYTYTSGMNTSPAITILNNNNVGISITNPSATLDINGSVRYRGSIYDQFNYVASGNFSNGTYYNIVGVNQITSGIYVLEGYIDTYAAGGGIYFMRFVSVPFYMYDVGSNSVTFQDLPPVLGTGHHRGDSFPTFRLQLTLAGAGVYLQFNPNTTWTGMDNSSGKTFQVNLKRIGS